MAWLTMILILVERTRGGVWEGEADGGRAVWWKDLSSIQSLIGGGVRGGRRQEIQDICIIYLEAFSSSDPSAVTICKHEVHLQGILQWIIVVAPRTA